ncbi:MAG TPA: ABC transporter ATP-binding protein [Candidatus Wallbacteria bacterium]|nr:ABC transporter ATP-binding protein [Candidatus Wallbacteria bacterium]
MNETVINAIEFINVSKHYSNNLNEREKAAVKNLCLTVKSGEVHGFLGHNGAGKTTAIKMATKLISPTSGEIKIFGRFAADSEYLEKTAYIAESVNFYQFLTPVEIMNYYISLNPASFGGTPKASLRDKISDSLNETGLLKWKDAAVEKFSKGMRQRLALALCLLREPDLLILDEPGSGLDPDGISLLLKIIEKFKKNSKTVFFSSHHISEIERVCDRVSIIKYGELLETIDLADYKNKPAGVEARYLELMRSEKSEI